jgi:hypothetical protein
VLRGGEMWGNIGVNDGQHWLWCGAILGDLKGKRKGRLGKRCVDGACGAWGESLWSAAMIGNCAGETQEGWMACRRARAMGVRGVEGFSGLNLMGRKPLTESNSTATIGFGVKLRLTSDNFLLSA